MSTPMQRRAFLISAASATALIAGCGTAPKAKPKIALALGGGAAKGFAHIGVIKVLEANGIVPDMIVGTSAGSLVGALYASGLNAFQLQQLGLTLEESTFSDWTITGRGLLRGEALANYVNAQLKNQPIEKLPRSLAIVATDVRSGEAIVFQRGDTGTAVRASSAVPGVFSPVRIGDRDYVDGGLTHPVPAAVARDLGADLVIAVDISAKPGNRAITGTWDILMQTFTIMGKRINDYELKQADVVIQPDIERIKSTDFSGRNLAILEGEKAAIAVMPELLRKLGR